MLDFSRLTAIGREKPLLHCVSNIVSANDCANVGLAVGASPMMAQAPEEMAEITARSAATVLNTGTPSAEKFSACMICGVESQRLGKPVVLDPVGIGASAWRLRWADELLAAFHPEILRVNFGEARALAHGAAEESGVDSLAQASTMARLALARRLARQAGSVVLLSGPEDIVTNGLDAFCICGGSARTAQVTGHLNNIHAHFHIHYSFLLLVDAGPVRSGTACFPAADTTGKIHLFSIAHLF